jgi:hypothetical protein
MSSISNRTMTELVEYSLVVMASTLLITGSVLIYGEYAAFESGITHHAAFDAVSALASRAVEEGRAKGTVSLPASVISCHGGVLVFAVGGFSENESLPLPCSFTVGISEGVHTLEFRDNSSQLQVSVK